MSELAWTKIDDLHRMILNTLLSEFGLDHLTETELDDLNRVWHRLRPWPDTVAGLTRLRERYMLATLSNGKRGAVSEHGQERRPALGRGVVCRTR